MGRGESELITETSSAGEAPVRARAAGSEAEPAEIIRCKLYRSGALTRPSLDERLAELPQRARSFERELAEELLACDELRPPGRVGRSRALFCSDDLAGLARWTRANLNTAPHDPTPRELSYVGPEPYAYPVLLWTAHRGSEDGIRRYWEAGTPLSEWRRRRSELASEHVWSDGAEILIDPDHVRGSRGVSLKRLLASVGESDAAQLKSAWKRRLGRTR